MCKVRYYIYKFKTNKYYLRLNNTITFLSNCESISA